MTRETDSLPGEAERLELHDVRNTAGHVFEHLQPNKAYSSSTIVDFAVAEGLLKENGLPLSRRRGRLWALLDLFARAHGFPSRGDRQILSSDLKLKPGWYGSRWLKAYRKSQAEQAKKAAQAEQTKKAAQAEQAKRYKNAVLLLDDETYYSASDVAAVALAHVYPYLSIEEQRQLYQRMSKALAIYAKRNHFPRQGDCLMKSPGLPPRAGYRGKRWKEIYVE